MLLLVFYSKNMNLSILLKTLVKKIKMQFLAFKIYLEPRNMCILCQSFLIAEKKIKKTNRNQETYTFFFNFFFTVSGRSDHMVLYSLFSLWVRFEECVITFQMFKTRCIIITNNALYVSTLH